MKRAESCLFLSLISLALVITGYVLVPGCLSSAAGHQDMMAGDDKNMQGRPAFPAMYNFPRDGPAAPGENGTGKYIPGDVLQPEESSPVFDRDFAVVVIRDTNDGSYEIDGVSRSDGAWTRLPDSVAGAISHAEIERLFPDKVDHVDVTRLSVGGSPAGGSSRGQPAGT